MGESHNTLRWLKVESIKETKSQENDSGACLFLYLLLQLKCLSNSLVTLVVPPLRQPVWWGERQNSDRQGRENLKEEIAGQDTESRGVIFLCGYIFEGKKSIYE